MQIIVNGETSEFEKSLTVQQLLDKLAPPQGRLAVEVNGEIVSRSEFLSHALKAGDRVEIVQAIGGG